MKIVAYLAILTLVISVTADRNPSAPEILEMQCKTTRAILSWSPTGDAPVTEYIVQYKTDWSPREWFNFNYTGLNMNEVVLILKPNSNYTFRVRSRNNFGVSEPSDESEVCPTKEDVPYRNPEAVYGRGDAPNNLAITWKPMPPSEHNAQGFYYKLYWKPADTEQKSWTIQNIREWNSTRYTIVNLPKLKPFKIKVEAYNHLGKAVEEAKEVIGYSDEDKPSEAPLNFKALSIRDGKSALLEWDPVSPLSLNGHFKGYKIHSWTKDPDSKKEEIIPPTVHKAMVDIFTPGEINNAQIFAFNGAFDGPPSHTIEIQTPVDVYPDAPEFAWSQVTEQNGGAVIRITARPDRTDHNPGKQIFIQYRRRGIDTLENWESTAPEDVANRKDEDPIDLTGLEFGTVYEVRVVAKCGDLTTATNVSIIETAAIKMPKLATIPSVNSIIHDFSIAPINSNMDDEHRNYPIDNQLPPLPPIRPTIQSAPVREEDTNIDVNKESGGLDYEDSNDSSFSKTPWFIALICVLLFISVFIGIFIFIKKRRTTGSHPNPSKKHVRTPSDAVRGIKMTKNEEPNENNHFIVPVNNNGLGNGNTGHDERDDDEDNHVVYKETTQRLQNV